MSSLIRVLVVEDSATVRDMLCEVLRSDGGFEVVGAAGDGQVAIDLCRELRPDVVTMDMMLPRLSGLAATEQIMAFCPTPILIVSASFNRADVFNSYDALAAGAVDVLEKPLGNEPAGEWERRFLDAVHLVSRIRVITHLRARSSFATTATARPQPEARAGRLIAIGASTGGPAAVVALLRSMPVGLGVPVLVVIHLNPQFGHDFADWLDTQTAWRACFATDGEPLAENLGTAILAPPGMHMIVRNRRVHLDDGPERLSCKPSVDVLFSSIAAECDGHAAAVLLTGMGRDGAAGLLAVRRSGGETIVQDEATSIVYGMPREAASIGAARRILPLGEIGPALTGLVRARSAVR